MSDPISLSPPLVNCVKIGRQLPALPRVPFSGALGQRIFDHVSAEGYALWSPHMTILINHYGLNPVEPETRKILREQMEEFFFGAEARLPDGWVPPGSGDSKGGDSKAGGSDKGAPKRK